MKNCALIASDDLNRFKCQTITYIYDQFACSKACWERILICKLPLELSTRQCWWIFFSSLVASFFIALTVIFIYVNFPPYIRAYAIAVENKENEWENFTTAAAARGKNKIVQRLTFGLMYMTTRKRSALQQEEKFSHSVCKASIATEEGREGSTSGWISTYAAIARKSMAHSLFWWYVHGKFIHMAFSWLSGRWCENFSSCYCSVDPYHRFHFSSLRALIVFYIRVAGIKSRLEIVMLLSPFLEKMWRVGNAYVKNQNSESSLVSFFLLRKMLLW